MGKAKEWLILIFQLDTSNQQNEDHVTKSRWLSALSFVDVSSAAMIKIPEDLLQLCIDEGVTKPKPVTQ